MQYLVQKHVSSVDHYDLRLETEPGVFRSWAVPKGIPTIRGQARLAVPTPDHYEESLPYEGIIQEGYGKGTVMLYDRGEWSPKDPLTDSKINFYVDSDRIQGGYFSLIKTGTNWLLMKHAGVSTDIPVDMSVLTGRTLEEIKMAHPFKPQLAKLVAEIPQGEEYLYSKKLDGYRLLAIKSVPEIFTTDEYPNSPVVSSKPELHIYSRTGELWDDKFPKILEDLKQIPLDTFKLDGEVHVEDSFAELHAGRGTPVYSIFDVPSYEGTLEERLEWLKDNIPESSNVRLLPHLEVSWDPCVLGQEGIMIKDKNQHYMFDQRKWMKFKCKSRQEFLVVGYTQPKGSRQHLGALLLGYYDNGVLKYAGKAGTGLTHEMLSEVYDKLQAVPLGDALVPKVKATWIQPKLVAEAEFMGWTDDNKLRHPVFISLRDDKLPTDVVREMSELTHPDKEIAYGVTKQDLSNYYEKIHEKILPELKDRPIITYRCPDGVDKPCFWQRNAVTKLPGLRIVDVDGRNHYIVEDKRGLQSLAQLNVVEIHSYNFTVEDTEHPDRLIFDIDSQEGATWETVSVTAANIRTRLQALDLNAFVKSTGGSGLHVVVPLRPEHSFEEVKAFAKDLCSKLVEEQPELYSLQPGKAPIYLDILRNDKSASTIATWSTRANGNVAVPIEWDEITQPVLENIDKAAARSFIHELSSFVQNLPVLGLLH